ncbi:polysaccharide deacetylase family protein [Streptomyces sp. TRM68367]|uniref:polysaccharide deacetylase family protein n=1 Tax=Streptomyces sp. TRM68367 TaxID=2758415 RepID=UPI00165AAF94|nr:polysaccharide deacetylase family protein [Streptomyces sp. TRM68367]MBC9728942.1 polysaccharide deacetylase family protein [Streptomyces sp. TRM68367]
MRKHPLFLSFLLLGSLTLTAACAGSGSSPGSPAPALEAGPAGSPAPAATRGVDPSRIKGLEIVNDSSEHSDCRWATSYPAVPGAAAMTAAMKKDVQRRLAAFLGTDRGDPSCGSAGSGSGQDTAGRELNIGYDFLVASGDVVGVRLTTLDRTAAGDGTETKTYWYDGADAAYRTASGLIADGSRATFLARLKQRLEAAEGVDAAMLDDALAAPSTLDDMVFTQGGALRITFDRGTIGPPAAGRVQVTLPPATVIPWLSDFGKRVRKQTVSPGQKLDLGAAPAPTTPVPTHTADGGDDTDCSRAKCIALTFDDGPAVKETAQLLTYLARYRARATFFVVGQNVAAHPDLVRAEARAGCEVGNHSWNHPDLTRLTPAQIRSQLDRTSAAIKAATGRAPTLFRPPYGAVNGTVKAATGLSPVLWDVDTEDWKYRDSAKVARSVIDKAKPNDVVLMHDIHATSVGAVPQILRTLGARGYHFVTVSHLRATL